MPQTHLRCTGFVRPRVRSASPMACPRMGGSISVLMLVTNIERRAKGHSHPGKQHTLHSRAGANHKKPGVNTDASIMGQAMPEAKLLQLSKRDLRKTILIHSACWGGAPFCQILG